MHKSTFFLFIVLLMLPLAVWAERTYPELWQQRLFASSLTYEPEQQALVHTFGTFIPTHIDKDITFTPQDNPVILRNNSTITSEAHLTIEAGTMIYAHEFSHIKVEGDVDINGTEANPVTIESNQKHPSRTTWNGLIFKPQSTGTITHTTIRHGAPAITCLPNSQVQITDTRLHMGDTGLFTSSPTCTIQNSVIHGVRDGIVTTLSNYDTQNTAIESSRKDVLIGN